MSTPFPDLHTQETHYQKTETPQVIKVSITENNNEIPDLINEDQLNRGLAIFEEMWMGQNGSDPYAGVNNDCVNACVQPERK